MSYFACRWEQDYKLQAWDQMSLFDEYLEMVIQVTLEYLEMVIQVELPGVKVLETDRDLQEL